MPKSKPKFRVGQVVYGWNGVRLFKIKTREYHNNGTEFDGWWYLDNEYQQFSERELRPLTARECGPWRKPNAKE